MNVSTNEARDLPAEKAHLSNGETSATPLEHSASVSNIKVYILVSVFHTFCIILRGRLWCQVENVCEMIKHFILTTSLVIYCKIINRTRLSI